MACTLLSAPFTQVKRKSGRFRTSTRRAMLPVGFLSASGSRTPIFWMNICTKRAGTEFGDFALQCTPTMWAQAQGPTARKKQKQKPHACMFCIDGDHMKKRREVVEQGVLVGREDCKAIVLLHVIVTCLVS